MLRIYSDFKRQCSNYSLIIQQNFNSLRTLNDGTELLRFRYKMYRLFVWACVSVS